MHAHTSHGHHHDHPHVVSDVLIGFVVLGLAFTALCIVLLRSGADQQLWHTLAVGVGIPSALTASYVCLRRAFEDSQ